MTTKKTKFTVEELVDILIKEHENETIEGQMLKPKYIRELYKQLGDPTKEDFGKEMEPAGTYWEKHAGYTTDIQFVRDKGYIKQHNNAPTEWYIKKASGTKIRIVENYTNNNWHCRVQAFNVICTKYVEHPRYKNVGVKFYSSRDCNKYEYFIIRGGR